MCRFFIFELVIYELEVIPSRRMNEPWTFQMMVDQILADLPFKIGVRLGFSRVGLVNLEDVTFFYKSIEEHLDKMDIIKIVMERKIISAFKVKLRKYIFENMDLEIFVHIVGEVGVSSDRER